MTQAPVLSFREEIGFAEAADDRLTLMFPGGGTTTLTDLTPGLLGALRILSAGGDTEDHLAELVLETDGAAALPRLYFQLERCGRLQLLRQSLLAGDEVIATVVPTTGGVERPPPRAGAGARFRLSRFAYCRRDGNALVFESPLSVARTILPGRTGAALVAELAEPRTYRDLCAAVPGLAEDTAQAFMRLLASAAVIAEAGELGTLREDDDPPLSQWAFHDLLFHSRSRLGGHGYPIGGTFPFLGRLPPLPAVKPTMSGEVLPLDEPDARHLQGEEPSFDRVLEARRSIRDYADEPITAKQLGEFLYRVARVRRVTPPDPERSRHYEITSRPYPTGGAAYDLELYVTVDTCRDIPGGIYHYDPLAHQLRRLADRNARVERLLRDAQVAGALSCAPQVLIIVASRFQRLSWKYSGIAYATTLKNVGVLYQTMYLVATAMGLAPCALGAGNSALLADTIGTDRFAESSVGEFLLGSKVPGCG